MFNSATYAGILRDIPLFVILPEDRFFVNGRRSSTLSPLYRPRQNLNMKRQKFNKW